MTRERGPTACAARTAPAPSALDREPFAREKRADALAQIALQFHAAVADRAAGAARTLQLLGELLQEGRAARQIVDDGHRLAAASGFLDAQLRGDSRGDRFGRRAAAAACAVALGTAAAGTHAADAGRVDE